VNKSRFYALSRIFPAEVGMKNSKDYSQKIQKLYRTLSHRYPKVQKVSHEKVIDAIVYAVISTEMSEKATESIIKKFTEYFVDWNDLRVSRTEEIVEVIGKEDPVAVSIASRLNRVLNGIFNQFHQVSLEGLKKIGKRPAKQALEKIDGSNNFVVDYCMLTSLGGHAIPLTEKMIKYLKDNELVNSDADQQQIEGFLAKQIPAKNGYDFYALLRQESESTKAKKKTRATSKKSKTKTKTKTTTKKRRKK
jgi:endonuclease III